MLGRARPLCALAFVLATGTACDRADCDAALDVVCACPSANCVTYPYSPPAARALKSCGGSDLRGDGYDLPACIQGSSRYCAIVAALSAADPALCEEPCKHEDACDLEQACHEFQYAHCDLPVRDAGVVDANGGDS